MKLNIIKLIFLLTILISVTYAQVENYYEPLNDIIIFDNQSSTQTQALTYVPKINLVGNYTLMVVAVGFSDFPSTDNWPHIFKRSTPDYYPYRGAFPDGTTLAEYLDINDSLDIEDYCADDNVSSCAAILETARILSGMDLNRSIMYAFWDEEEIDLLGSRYSAAIADSNSTNIAGVVNIEMLGWDSDNDGLFDIHVRDIANTIQLGDLLVNTTDEYDLELTPNIINPGTDRSDHAAFWDYGYTALALT